MRHWNEETGEYKTLSAFLEGFGEDVSAFDLAKEDPNKWFSKPGGNYQIGISFHYPPFTFAEGSGIFENRYTFRPSPFILNTHQDPYNSWGVNARLSKSFSPSEDFWDWNPGIMIVDTQTQFTLPSEELSLFAGCEWADNDFRIFHGLYSNEIFDQLVFSTLKVINRITGPGWVNWPFGNRQLAEAVLFWISTDSDIPELMLQAAVKQENAKFVYLGNDLYNPGDTLGAWEKAVDSWDCRQAIRFLYQSKLLFKDGLPEMALSCAIASLENASAEILTFLVHGNNEIVENELNNIRFLDRFDKVLPKYKASIPKPLFEKLRKAYFARNGIVHGLRPVKLEQASEYLETIEEVLKWYWLHIGNGFQINKSIKEKEHFPF